MEIEAQRELWALGREIRVEANQDISDFHREAKGFVSLLPSGFRLIRDGSGRGGHILLAML